MAVRLVLLLAISSVCSNPVFWTDGFGQFVQLEEDPLFAFDGAAPPPSPPPTSISMTAPGSISMTAPGITLATGSAAFTQSADTDPFMDVPSLGGPFDLDPADYPSRPPQFPTQQAGLAFLSRSPNSGSLTIIKPSFDLEEPSVRHQRPFSRPGFAPVVPPIVPTSNQANGSVINTGSAAKGMLDAAGGAETNIGRFGAGARGTGSLTGAGLGLSGTQINTVSAGSNPILPAGFPDFGGSAGATFLNTMAAEKGKISGNSNTVSRTGPGSSFGSSSGSASGMGQGVQLTQVANANAQGTGGSPRSFRSPALYDF